MSLNDESILESAHDVADGGLYITLLESGFANELGIEISSDTGIRKDAFLFGEAQGRIVVSVTEEHEFRLKELLEASNTVFQLLGTVTKGEISVDSESFGTISEAKSKFDSALAHLLA